MKLRKFIYTDERIWNNSKHIIDTWTALSRSLPAFAVNQRLTGADAHVYGLTVVRVRICLAGWMLAGRKGGTAAAKHWQVVNLYSLLMLLIKDNSS
jgi:hypothetical protein